jgi:phosphatidylglycerol---prolipoprotein diacylglyceryl transferase
MLLSIVVDPPRVAFTIPLVYLDIYWYSILFALGFLLSYFLILFFIRRYVCHHNISINPQQFTDSLSWYIFFGSLIGARLGHVFFYDWDYYRVNLLDIIMIRKGGLASHGGAIGILISLTLFWFYHLRKEKIFSFLKLLDYLCVVACLAGGFIRIGNFFNQEILGTPTSMPWGFIFLNPSEVVDMPCHPVQLYESIGYFVLFAFLFWKLTRREDKMKDGYISGLFFVLLFSFRFFVEYFKVPQGQELFSFVHTGQILSLPFIATGFLLLYKKY